MSKKIKKMFQRKADAEEKALEELKVLENPMVGEIGSTIVAILPLAIIAGALEYVRQVYDPDPVTKMIMAVGALVVYLAFLVTYLAIKKEKQSSKWAFQIEFGYHPRIRPRHNILCGASDIIPLDQSNETIRMKVLSAITEKCKGSPELYEQMKAVLPDLPDPAAKTEAKPKKGKEAQKTEAKAYNMTYIKHPNYPCLGVDRKQMQIIEHQTTLIFHAKPTDEQFTFAECTNFWIGPLVYNHPRAESLNVQVSAVIIDPFTNTPMPVCLLKHCSNDYEQDEPSEPELKLQEMFIEVMAAQNGEIHALRKDAEHKDQLIKSDQSAKVKIITYADEITATDWRLWTRIMRPLKRSWWSKLSPFAKAIVVIVAIVVFGVVMLYALNVLPEIQIGALNALRL